VGGYSTSPEKLHLKKKDRHISTVRKVGTQTVLLDKYLSISVGAQQMALFKSLVAIANVKDLDHYCHHGNMAEVLKMKSLLLVSRGGCKDECL
jgi:hypothetical protein